MWVIIVGIIGDFRRKTFNATKKCIISDLHLYIFYSYVRMYNSTTFEGLQSKRLVIYPAVTAPKTPAIIINIHHAATHTALSYIYRLY